ncbi:hypothetical protein DRO97_02645 [Archaeoglobales archaeon]|nr:MAG: hypothetical protein DRO97_02645 [Archaeoglobales archaeon]
MKYYNIHNILKIKTNIDTFIPDYFSVDHVDDPDIEFLITDLPEFDVRMKQSGVFWHGICEDTKTLYIKYKVPIGDARLMLSDLNGKTKVYFTKTYYKYSNLNELFEQILSIKLLQKDHALIHSGCVAKNGKATLITALRDTGKTSTILQLLKHGYSFMSDDLTIVSPDGVAYCFPEPVSISPFTTDVGKDNIITKLKKYMTKSRFEIVLGDVFKIDMTKKQVITDVIEKADINNVYILSTGNNEINKVSPIYTTIKITNTTYELFNPFRHYLLVFYANLFFIDLYQLMQKHGVIVYSALERRKCECYEIKRFDTKYFYIINQKVTP